MRRVLNRTEFEDHLDVLASSSDDAAKDQSYRVLLEHFDTVAAYYAELHRQNATMRENALARRSDPDTSKAAARSLDPEKLGRVRENILRIVEWYGPISDEAIADHYGYISAQMQSGQSLRSRRSELCQMEPPLIEDSGERALNAGGRKVILWRAVDPQRGGATHGEDDQAA